MSDDEIREDHQSFGMINWSRMSSGGTGTELFGSELRHSQLISLTISTGHRTRHLNQDWYYDDKVVAQVYMSAAQFSEFITTPNASSVPCTFTHRADIEGRVEDYPGHPGAEELSREGFKKGVREAMQKAQDLANKATATLKGGNLKAADRKELIRDIEQLVQQVKSNLPFVADQFAEAMDKTVTDGKQELEAFGASVVRRHGLAALGERVPELSYGDDVDPMQKMGDQLHDERLRLADDMGEAREKDKNGNGNGDD